MDELKISKVPAFGSWDCSNHDHLPFTQCFESARQRYNYSQDRDLYVAGDLYDNDVVTPAMIVVPRRKAKARDPYVKVKQATKEAWVVCGSDFDMKEPTSPVAPRYAPNAVDEDLYNVSPPELLRAKPKRRVWGFFSSCLLPTSCVL